MKIFKTGLIIFSLLCIQMAGYCDSYKSKSYWGSSSPGDVAAQANKMQSINPSASDSEDGGQGTMFNPMGSIGNMLQMINGTSYNAVEQQKQQIDYTKQQFSN